MSAKAPVMMAPTMLVNANYVLHFIYHRWQKGKWLTATIMVGMILAFERI
jgi:hypothetical protein